jgi:hypothetical protein
MGGAGGCGDWCGDEMAEDCRRVMSNQGFFVLDFGGLRAARRTRWLVTVAGSPSQGETFW